MFPFHYPSSSPCPFPSRLCVSTVIILVLPSSSTPPPAASYSTYQFSFTSVELYFFSFGHDPARRADDLTLGRPPSSKPDKASHGRQPPVGVLLQSRLTSASLLTCSFFFYDLRRNPLTFPLILSLVLCCISFPQYFLPLENSPRCPSLPPSLPHSATHIHRLRYCLVFSCFSFRFLYP